MTIGPDSKVVESWSGEFDRTYTVRTCDAGTRFFGHINNAAGECIGMSDNSYKTATGARRWLRRMERA